MFINLISRDKTEPVISLDSFKAIRNINNSISDEKLEIILNSAIDLFENLSGYYLRESVVELGFSSSDSLRGDRRGTTTFFDRYSSNYNFNSNTEFSFPISTISNKDIGSFSVLSMEDNKSVSLDSDQIIAFNDSNSILILKSNPLRISFNFNFINTELTEFRRLTSFKMRMKTDRIEVSSDINLCILRIASRLHEYPDDQVEIESDGFISSTIDKYKIDYLL